MRARPNQVVRKVVIDGENVHTVARKCWAVLAKMVGTTRELPEMVVRRRKAAHSTGRAWGTYRFALTFGTRADAAKVRELVLHELAHCAHSFTNGLRREKSHGPEYNKILVDAAAKLWRVHVGYGTGYGPSRTLERMLREKLRPSVTQATDVAQAS